MNIDTLRYYLESIKYIEPPEPIIFDYPAVLIDTEAKPDRKWFCIFDEYAKMKKEPIDDIFEDLEKMLGVKK